MIPLPYLLGIIIYFILLFVLVWVCSWAIDRLVSVLADHSTAKEQDERVVEMKGKAYDEAIYAQDLVREIENGRYD